MHNELIEIDVDFNKELLLKEALNLNGYQTFLDPRDGKPVTGWNVKLINQGYGLYITQLLKHHFRFKRCSPRFYIQEPGIDLPFHTDRDTLSSLNFLLSGDDDPISFRNKTVFYKNCLLDTTVEHAVINPKFKRVLFKISIFDKSFEEMKQLLLPTIKL